MSTSEFGLLGQAIADELAAAFPAATAAFRRRTLAELSAIPAAAWLIEVIPKAHETASADRSSRNHRYTFDVVWRRRFSLQADEATELDPLDYDVEAAEDTVYAITPTINQNLAECVQSRREPPYDPEALAQGVFLAVITATWTLQR